MSGLEQRLRLAHRQSLAMLVVATVATVAVGSTAAAAASGSGAASSSGTETGWVDIERLSEVRVVSASKREESLSRIPAAVHVISSQEIAGSGYTRLPEILRLAPGMQVARISPSSWAISARGFNSQDSRKLLVLMDGRSVYSTLFSGVWWDAQDTLIDNIDRIEVVRGPGGATWGVNAVTGVVNVISKSAIDTLGSYVEAGGGDLDRLIVGGRYGWRSSAHSAARVYLRHTATDDFPIQGGGVAQNGYDMTVGGFRVDWDRGKLGSLTVQGDLYSGRLEQRIDSPSSSPPYFELHTETIQTGGANLMARWTRPIAENFEFNMNSYVDLTRRKPYVVDETRNTASIEARFHWRGAGHDLAFGSTVRVVKDDLHAGNFRAFWQPSATTHDNLSLFLQDEWTTRSGKLAWIGGALLDRNDYTGWEIQPTFRVLGAIAENQSVWGGISRAVQTPDRIRDFRLRVGVIPPSNETPLTLIEVIGHPRQRTEQVDTIEAGWRWNLGQRLFLDIAAYHNRFLRLRTVQPPSLVISGDPPQASLRAVTGNDLSASNEGLEIGTRWQASGLLQLSLAYTWIRSSIDTPSSPIFEGDDPNSPRHLLTLQGTFLPTAALQLSALARYVGQVPEWAAPQYLAFDLTARWHAGQTIDLQLAAQGLGAGTHFEAPSGRGGTPSEQVPAGFYAKVVFRR